LYDFYGRSVCVVQGEHVVKEVFPKKVAELNALLEVCRCQSLL